MTLRLIISLFILSFTAATPALAKVLGSDQMVPVNGTGLNVPRGMHTIVKAVGLMNPMGCTGTHIGNGFVITAGHCFDAPQRVVENAPCQGITIQWGVRGENLGRVSNCVRIVGMELNNDRDWAVFQVDRAPIEYAQINPSARMQLGQMLTIFSHANTEPLRWSRTCRLVRPFPSPFSPKALHHMCDTNPGSSGAAIIDVETQTVIGIHDGGNNQVNYGTYLATIPLQQLFARNRVRLPVSF